jgi:hypothetical protein
MNGKQTSIAWILKTISWSLRQQRTEIQILPTSKAAKTGVKHSSHNIRMMEQIVAPEHLLRSMEMILII